jgi:glycyl-tRNA synthetase beta chain
MGDHEIHTVARASFEVTYFLIDRFKVLMRDEGFRHDLVEAATSPLEKEDIQDDFVLNFTRLAALSKFVGTDDGVNLLAGYRRAVNILKAEEKKSPLPAGLADKMPNSPIEEVGLIDAIWTIGPSVDGALARDDFEQAILQLASLRDPVDAFFDKVLVNSEVAAERDNRLRLLGQVRDLMGRVADFSLITG